MSRTTTRIMNGFALVLSLSLTMASLPASAQAAYMPSREAIRSLNLSRAQMGSLRSIIQAYQTDLAALLTPEQQELRQSLRQEGEGSSLADQADQLNLSEEQVTQLSTLQEALQADLQAVLTPEQLEQLNQLGILDSF